MRILLILSLLFVPILALAGDYHESDGTHQIIYTIVDSSGNHVTGETVRLTVRSHDSVNYYSWTNATWGAFSPDSQVTINEDSSGGFYHYTFTADAARLVSGDYVFIISNESASFADLQAETVHFGQLGDLIRIHR